MITKTVNWNISKDYNDTIDSKIATVCLRAFDIYDKELENVPHYISDRTAIARAIGDAIKESIHLVQINLDIGRKVPENILEDKNFIQYELRNAFMLMADEIYNSEHWRVKQFGFPEKNQFEFTIGILKMDKK